MEGSCCRFGALEITKVSTSRLGTRVICMEEEEVEVLPKEIYFGGKFTTKWKDVTRLEVFLDEEEWHLECSSFQARVAQPLRGSVSWPAFAKALTKRWDKLQRKKERQQQEELEEQQRAKTAATCRPQKPRSSRAARFLSKNLQNIQEFDSDDDQVFNRLTPKELAAKKQQEQLADEEEEEHFETDEPEPVDIPMDEASVAKVEPDEDEKLLDDSDDEAVTPPQQDVPQRPTSTNKNSNNKPKLRKLKRKRQEEDDQDSDDDIFGPPQFTTPTAAQRIVSPATVLRKSVFTSEDNEDEEETQVEPPGEVSKVSATAPITNFFAPRTKPRVEAATVETATEESQPAPSVAPINAAKDISSFFAPKKTAPSHPPAATNTGTDRSTPMETPPTQDDDTVILTSSSSPEVSSPSQKNTPTSNKTLGQSTSKSSVIKSPFFSSTQKEINDDPIVDGDEETFKETPSKPLAKLNRRLFVQRKKTFGSRNAQPSRRLALAALDQADVSSPTTSGSPTTFTGMDSSNPSVETPPPATQRSSPTTRSASSPVEVIPTWRGLRNLGNTCYMNSSLQMLYSVPAFLQAISGMQGGRRLTSSFYQTYQGLKQKAAGAVNPRDVKTAMDDVSQNFHGYQQRDAHEFLGSLVDHLHEELGSPPYAKKGKENVDPNAAPSKSSKMLPTDDFFRLNVEVCLKCKSCGYTRSKEEMYRNLSVDIVSSENDKKPTVERCLESFFQPEERDIKCEKCEEGNHAIQTMRVINRPKVLLLHLKRFVVEEKPRSADEKGPAELVFHKNRAAVELSSEVNLQNFCKESIKSGDGSYSLQSIVHHIGNAASSGHYTADALRGKEAEEGSDGKDEPQWVSYDDGVATETNLADLQQSAKNQSTAYILLYYRD